MGFFPRSSRIVAMAYVRAAGSPGPFDRNIPSGDKSRISLAVVVAGTAVTLQLMSTRHRRILRLAPKSIATTCSSDARVAMARRRLESNGTAHDPRVSENE